MITEPEYALLASAAYQSTKSDVNLIQPRSDWNQIAYTVMDSSTEDPGFEAVAYMRGNEIVVAYTGTTGIEDWDANLGLGGGFYSSQLLDAARFYLEVCVDYPDAEISLTGHSLGGGLASLVAVLFDEEATTFDQAPFRAAANNDVRDQLLADLLAEGYGGGTQSRLWRLSTATCPLRNPAK